MAGAYERPDGSIVVPNISLALSGVMAAPSAVPSGAADDTAGFFSTTAAPRAEAQPVAWDADAALARPASEDRPLPIAGVSGIVYGSSGGYSEGGAAEPNSNTAFSGPRLYGWLAFSLTSCNYGSNADTSPVTVSYQLGGSHVGSGIPAATPGKDYSGPLVENHSVQLADHSTVLVPFRATADNEVEGQEEVRATITGGAGTYRGAGNFGFVYIDDSPPVVSLEATDPHGTENAAGEAADPLKFTIRRRGGAVNTPLDVTYIMSGTAKPGARYVTPSGTVAVTDAATIQLDVLDDLDAEGLETVFMQLTGGSPYPGSPYMYDGQTTQPATAPATGPATVPAGPKKGGDVDDNVSVKSFSVKRIAEGSINGVGGYDFDVAIEVQGEHLDKAQIRQTINSSTSLTDWDKTNLTRPQVLAALPGADPVVVDSGGKWEVDTNWDWQGLKVVDGSKNGLAKHFDHQGGSAAVGRIAILPNGDTTQLSWLGGISRYFRLETRKAGEIANLNSFSWGYKWNNYGAFWSRADGSPVASAASEHLAKGKLKFYDIQGITNLDTLNS